MKRKISRLLTSLLLAAISGAVNAQDISSSAPAPDTKMIPSVTGNSSIANISSPDLFDGSANVNIPIYDFTNSYGSYGVSFSYNTKGVKVDELSSAAGNHWNINAGGTIQRVLKDMPDEVFKPKTISGTEVSDSIVIMGKLAYALSSYTDPVQHVGNYIRSRFDEEYDDFIVSVPGLSFTFNIGKGGFVFTHPHKQVKVELLNDGVVVDSLTAIPPGGARNLSFIITDDRGIQYYFEKDALATYVYASLSDVNAPVGIKDYITTAYIQNWNLSRILFPDGSQIRYYYKAGKSGGSWLATMQGQSVANYDAGSSSIKDYMYQNADVKFDYEISSVIDSISYPNNVVVDFIYRDFSLGIYRCDYPGGPLLDEVKVFSEGRSLRYRLKQKYVNSKTGGVLSTDAPCESISGMPMDHKAEWYYRLFLERIETSNSDLSKTELYYKFNYHSVPLPHRMHGAKDIYGYYNGNAVPTDTPTLSIPRHRNFYASADSFGIWRFYNANYAQAGLLKRIINAYGGVTEYEYEGHVLSQPNIPFPTSSVFHGRDVPDGVRLKRTIQYDEAVPDQKIYTNFTYEGGILFMPGGYFHFPRSVDATGTVKNVYVNNNFTSAHQLINGSNHGYSRVTTTITNYDGELLSKQVIRFTNIVDSSGTPKARYTIVGSNRHYYQYPFADRQYLRDWEIGLPVEVMAYDQNNKLIERTMNQYTFSMDSASTSGKVENKKILKMYRSKYAIHRIDSASYRPYTGKALLAKTISQKYVTDASIIHDTVHYTYDLRDNLSTIKSANSEKQYVQIRNIYNYQLGNPPVSLGGFPYPLAVKIGSETWKLSPSGSASDILVDASINKYNLSSGKLRMDESWKLIPGQPVTRSVYELNSSSANEPDHQLKTAYSASNPGTSYRSVTEVLQRDLKGNTEELRMLDRDITQVMLWDSISGNQLAGVAGAHYDEVGYAGFDEAIANNAKITAASIQHVGHFSAYLISYQPVSSSGICGKYYKLDPTFGYNVKFEFNMKTGKEYILSFWCRGTTPNVIGGGISSFTFQEVYTQGSWKYYVVRFTATATTPIELRGKSGSTIYVDEVRLHPSDVQMQTNTYTPLFGKSAEADARGRITYYEYDDFGRLITVRDQEGRILKHIEINMRSIN